VLLVTGVLEDLTLLPTARLDQGKKELNEAIQNGNAAIDALIHTILPIAYLHTLQRVETAMIPTSKKPKTMSTATSGSAQGFFTSVQGEPVERWLFTWI